MPAKAGRSRKRRRIGLALAGGGPEGAVYEIGALRALDEALDGLDLHELDIYVGVSAGAFIAASLANDLTTTQMVRALVKHEPGEHPFVPQTFFTPNYREWARRSLMLPRLFADAMLEFRRAPEEQTLFESLTKLARALPVGLFDNEPIRRYLQRSFSIKGRQRRLPGAAPAAHRGGHRPRERPADPVRRAGVGPRPDLHRGPGEHRHPGLLSAGADRGAELRGRHPAQDAPRVGGAQARRRPPLLRQSAGAGRPAGRRRGGAAEGRARCSRRGSPRC